MSWTYSGDPSSAPKDEVRFLVGDTMDGDPLVSDEEIAYTLNNQNGTTEAAVVVCRAIAARFARLADKSVGDLKISLSQKTTHYMDLADRLQRQAGILAIPYSGGLLQSEKDILADDPSQTQPAFKRGMMDNGVGLPGIPESDPYD